MKEIIFKLLFLVTFCLTTIVTAQIISCNGKEQGRAFKDPLTCHKFYVCDSLKRLYYKECPGDLHFKENGGYCTTQDDAGCIKPTPTPGPHPTPGPTPGPHPTPGPTPGPHPTPGPTPGPHPTPGPTPGPHPTPGPTPGPHPTPGPDPTPEPTTSPYTKCKNAPFGKRIRYPNDCHKFLICITEHGIEMKCPAQLHFRADLEVCDFPQRAKCPWW